MEFIYKYRCTAIKIPSQKILLVFSTSVSSILFLGFWIVNHNNDGIIDDETLKLMLMQTACQVR
jgi:hypothetical protein